MQTINMAQQPQAYFVQGGQPNATVIIQAPPQQSLDKAYAKQQSKIIGIIQIIVGVCSMIFNIVAIGVSDCSNISFLGHGIWCGIFFIISGGLGIGASAKPTQCLIVGHMVMSILSACFSGVQLSLGTIASILAVSEDCGSNVSSETVRALHITLSAVALLEAVMAIWASAICCAGLCCRRSTQGVIFPANQQAVVTNAGQVLYPQSYVQVQQPQPQLQQQAFVYQQQQQQYTPNIAPTLPNTSATTGNPTDNNEKERA